MYWKIRGRVWRLGYPAGKGAGRTVKSCLVFLYLDLVTALGKGPVREGKGQAVEMCCREGRRKG